MEELKKYMRDRKLVTFTCDNCGKEAQKPLSEYTRNQKLGRHNFCSRRCCIIYNNKHHIPSEKQIENRKNIGKYSDNKKDEYSKFRYTFRNARKRYKEFNLTLDYLKEVWEKQNGICPYTGLHLILPSYTSSCDIIYRASLDRIDSSLGYIIGNVQFVSTPINFMKSTMSDLQTKQFLKQISDYTSHFCEDGTISSSD